MVVEQEAKIEETKGEKFKANVKSDDFLMRQFFTEFVKACRSYLPSLASSLDLAPNIQDKVHVEQESGSQATEPDKPKILDRE